MKQGTTTDPDGHQQSALLLMAVKRSVRSLNQQSPTLRRNGPPAFIGLLEADYCSGAARIEMFFQRVLLVSIDSGIVSLPSLFAMM